LQIKSEVKFDSVSFSYGDVTVLDSISFEINKGDFAVFTGPNGGGKTTAVKLICSLIKPTAGSLVFGDGKNNKAKIGYVAQRKPQFDYYFPLSVYEAIGLSFAPTDGLFAPGGATAKSIENAISIVDLEELKNRYIDELSGGQKQRVFIARALAMEPDVLILDEPTSGIDSISQESLLAYIEKAVKQKEMTIIYVTHDISEVCGMANRRFEFSNKSVYEKELVTGAMH